MNYYLYLIIPRRSDLVNIVGEMAGIVPPERKQKQK